MRSVAPTRPLTWGLLLVLGLAGCSASRPAKVDEDAFDQPNPILADEIRQRVDEIPYQHREELFDNLLWLQQRGEVAIPALLDGLRSDEPKVRSNCAWVLGSIGDRRTIPALQPLVRDDVESVRLEAARSLVKMGDLRPAPVLIEGLDSDKVQVRYLCHEALKRATLHDFDYDHLAEDPVARAQAVYRWRTWWAEQSQDRFFASNYARDHGIDTGEAAPVDVTPLGQPAAPSVETAPVWMQQGSPTPQPDTSGSSTPRQPTGAQGSSDG
ncbi:MAG: HEAT repeat domain-containing protein [Planctomycetes bacterium]|nr:HEAT repeat domain-containing protein [Planctomycetota bacterium]